ncbi:MAG: mraZ [Opitutaceae bacterium]|nr:mraZ [Opitutaceae bacterium]
MPPADKANFAGNFPRTLDDKGRLTIPSEWRSAHTKDEPFMAIPHKDGYLAILPTAEVNKLREKLSANKLNDSGAQDSAAVFFSETQSFACDNFGRVVLNRELLQHAGIDKEAVLIGSLTKFHVYSPDRWQQLRTRVGGGKMGEAMRHLDI